MKFLRDVFSDHGTPSFARVAPGVIIAATLGWITYLVLKNNALPDLTGPTMFVGGSGLTHFLPGKVAGMIDAYKKNDAAGKTDNAPKTDEAVG